MNKVIVKNFYDSIKVVAAELMEENVVAKLTELLQQLENANYHGGHFEVNEMVYSIRPRGNTDYCVCISNFKDGVETVYGTIDFEDGCFVYRNRTTSAETIYKDLINNQIEILKIFINTL